MKKRKIHCCKTSQERCQMHHARNCYTVNETAADKQVDILKPLEMLVGTFDGGMKQNGESIICFNETMQRFSSLGLVHPSLYLGPVILSRGYGVHGPSDSGELVQLGLCTERGAVVMTWDTDEYGDLENGCDFECEAYLRASPLPECSAAIQVLAWPQMGPLMEQFLRALPIS